MKEKKTEKLNNAGTDPSRDAPVLAEGLREIVRKRLREDCIMALSTIFFRSFMSDAAAFGIEAVNKEDVDRRP